MILAVISPLDADCINSHFCGFVVFFWGGTFYIGFGRGYGLECRFTGYMGTLAAEIACRTGGSAGGGDAERREGNWKD